jgi:hypothetical protein
MQHLASREAFSFKPSIEGSPYFQHLGNTASRSAFGSDFLK